MMECFAKKYCDQNEGVFTSTGNLTVQEYPPLLIVRELYELIFKGGKIGEHCSQEMLNSCRKFV
jgi:hypothetical protein